MSFSVNSPSSTTIPSHFPNIIIASPTQKRESESRFSTSRKSTDSTFSNSSVLSPTQSAKSETNTVQEVSLNILQQPTSRTSIANPQTSPLILQSNSQGNRNPASNIRRASRIEYYSPTADELIDADSHSWNNRTAKTVMIAGWCFIMVLIFSGMSGHHLFRK